MIWVALAIAATVLLVWLFLIGAKPTVYRVASVEAMAPYLRWLEGASRYGVIRIFVQDFNLKVNLRFWNEEGDRTEIHIECLSGALTRGLGLRLKASLKAYDARMRYYRAEYPPRLILKIRVPDDRIVSNVSEALRKIYDLILPESLLRGFEVFGEGDLFGPRYWRWFQANFANQPPRNWVERYTRRKIREGAKRPAHPIVVQNAKRP